MSSSYLDRYGRLRTICHRLPARLKLFLTAAVILAGLLTPVELWPLHGVLATLVFIGHSLAHIPLRYLLRRLAIFLPMVCVLSLSFPLSQGLETGWEVGASILLRTTLSFVAMLWLVNVMPFEQLLVTLRRCGAPAVLVAMLSFMYRYLFVLWDELDKMRTARKARTFAAGASFADWRSSAQLIGMLLIRAMERAERVHGAMCARGWDGRVRTLDELD